MPGRKTQSTLHLSILSTYIENAYEQRIIDISCINIHLKHLLFYSVTRHFKQEQILIDDDDKKCNEKIFQLSKVSS